MRLLLRIHSLVAAAAGGEIAWEGEIAFEGVDTSDDRRIAPGALVWRELPLSLMAQTETAPGHDGARLAGRIDAIERRDGGVIFASGAFVGEYGVEIASMVETEALRGVSVDMAVLEYEIEPSEEAADDEGDGDALDLLFGPTGTFVVLSGEIMGATRGSDVVQVRQPTCLLESVQLGQRGELFGEGRSPLVVAAAPGVSQGNGGIVGGDG
jgi:hypothetical protein